MRHLFYLNGELLWDGEEACPFKPLKVLQAENAKMSKYNHSRKARVKRRWYQNVGDGAKLTKAGTNPNDAPRGGKK